MNKREKLLREIYERKRLALGLNIFSFSVSALCAAVFFALLAVLAWKREFLDVIAVILTTGVPFFAVGAVRRMINAPRPYEIYSFYEKNPKQLFPWERTEGKSDRGRSFPSRHAYSAFAIATVVFFISPWLGAAMWTLGAFMCAARVLLGIHFIRDVICGAAVGVLAGTIGKFLLKIFI